MQTPLNLTPQSKKFIELVKKDPVLSSLAEEHESYYSAVDEALELDNEDPEGENKVNRKRRDELGKQMANSKWPILDSLTLEEGASAQDTFKHWREALLKFVTIDSALPLAPIKNKAEEKKMRVEIVNSLREQSQGNPIAAAFDNKGAKGVINLFPHVFATHSFER